MKKNLGFYVATALLVTSLSAANVMGSTDDEISAVQSSKAQSQDELTSTQERIASLEEKKGVSEEYLTELNTQLEDLTDNLETLQQQYDDSQVELGIIQEELSLAEEEEHEQYEDMKLRIQYMYESTINSGALETLLSSGSLSEFLNRATTMSEMTNYDRQMLQKYQETVQNVSEKKTEEEAEQQEIERLQAETTEQQEQVQEIYEATYVDVQTFAASIEDAEVEAAALIQSINEKEEALNGLLAEQMQERIAEQRRAEEAAAAEREAEEIGSPTQEIQYEEVEGEDGDIITVPVEVPAEEAYDEETPSDSGDDTYTEEPAQENGNDSGQGGYLGCFKITAYCPCASCCGVYAANPGITASGAYATPGYTVAMGGVPFGTQLMINGTVYVVEDRGTAYGHVDIYFADHESALAFGMQYADVYQVG